MSWQIVGSNHIIDLGLHYFYYRIALPELFNTNIWAGGRASWKAMKMKKVLLYY